jgi:hypothetical protein
MGDLKERAVRRYLDFLTDSVAEVDNELIAELEKQFDSSGGSIEKLRVLSDIAKAKRPDRSTLEEGFVANAYDWALTNGIVPDAFRSMGVEPEVLQKAGFEKIKATVRPLPSPTPTLSAAKAPKAPLDASSEPKTAETPKKPKLPKAAPVRLNEIVPVILAQKSRFTVAQIHDQSGGSLATVRTAVLSLVSSGDIRARGTKTGALGKNPMTYEVTNRS